MSPFYVVNESSEDTLEAGGDLQDAVRVAREVARQGPVGDPVSVLESGGKAIRQFVRMSDGTVSEQLIGGTRTLPAPTVDLDRAHPSATIDPASR